MTPPTPTPKNETLANASAGLSNGFADSAGLVVPSVIIVLYAVGALLAARVLAPHVADSRLLERVGKRVAVLFTYAIKGTIASAVLALIALPAYLVATVDGETRGIAAEYVALAVVGFAALVVVGWLADRAATAYIDAHPHYEEVADLFPDTEDTSDGAETAGD